MSLPRLWPSLRYGDDEAPTSYLSRLAALHGRNPRGFCRDMSLDFQGVVDGDIAELQALAHLVDIDPLPLESNAIRKVGEGRYLWQGRRLVSSSLRRATIRVCPLCIVADVEAEGRLGAYGRTSWTLDAVRACPTHSVGLEAIGTAVTPGELHDFASAVAPAIDQIASLAASATVLTRSDLEDHLLARKADGTTGKKWLDELAWHALADACETIGAVALHGPDIATSSLNDLDWRAAGDAGHAIVVDGEDGIRSLLCHLDATFPASRASTDGPQARYGSFFKRLASTSEEPDLEPLRAIIARHLIETTPLGPEDKLFGKRFGRRMVMSIRSASMEFKIHPKRLRKILVAKKVIGPETVGTTDERTIFPATPETVRLIERSVRSLSLTEAETYLNAGRVHTKLLADGGFIEPFVQYHKATRGAELNFAIDDLYDFLERLLSGAEDVVVAPAGANTIPTAAKQANCRANEIISLILDGKLGWTGRLVGTAGYRSVLVRLDEVKRLTRGDELGGFNGKLLEQRLKTATKVVKALMDLGVLQTKIVVHPIKRCPTRIVPFADVERFESEYISLTALSAERGLHFRALKKRLDGARIKPALDPKIVEATFYRRSDLTRNAGEL